ncbi:asparaginase domain-containing protein [Sulfurovum riftiae]|uniref:Asparaginase n=1 Tax=Sulfurovum riftiae TaxID=1630136 RepID=A0A151CJN3_9BACT|nr:asparaginase domain-containing protein [Sulfurovum riftiae]KYJ87752.1 asparaginase [Sulfurovum riftiae]
MQKILIISTGGTFNKVYDPVKGDLVIDETSHAVKEIASKWLCRFELMNIIGKDSLAMTNQDRLELLSVVTQTEHEKIIIIHGTDTMHLTAEYLADVEIEKKIILTGAMVPYTIDPVEATANLSSALGYMQLLSEDGVYTVMNGLFGSHEKIIKEKSKGKFIRKR